MPLNPEMAGLMLRIILRSLRHFFSEVVRIFLGMAASAAATFSFRLGGKVQQVVNRVQVPHEDRLPGGPFPISLHQLL